MLTTPFVMRLVMASLAEFDPAVEEAARNLGAGRWRTFFQITLPLIRPGVLAGAVFAFIISFDELVVTLFLAGPGMADAADPDLHLCRVFEHAQRSRPSRRR